MQIGKILFGCLFIFAFIFSFQLMAGGDTPAKWREEKADDAVFAIVAGNKEKGEGAAVDITGKNKVTATGINVGNDESFGSYFEFADDGKTALTLRYDGPEDVLKGKGFTLEAWIMPEAGALKTAGLATKIGSFDVSFKDDKLNIAWVVLPTETIYAEPGTKQYNYYPMAWGMGGLLPLKKSEWNHIAVVYDENMKLMRTWVNGVLDRDNELMRDGQQWVKVAKGDFWLFRDMRNCRIGGMRLRAGVHDPGDVPAMKAYLNQLPWQEKMVLTADKINPGLKLPIVIEAVLEGIPGGVYSRTLSSHDTAHIEIPMPKGDASERVMKIKLMSDGKQVYETSMGYMSVLPAPGKGVSVNADKSLSVNGKKVFPLFMYHVNSEDIPAVKKMGFNIVSGKDTKGRWMSLPAREIEDSLAYEKAVSGNNMFVSMGVNFANKNFNEYMEKYRTLPGIFVWYCADEPWRDWDIHRKNYNSIRATDQNHPVVTVVNMTMHMKNAGPICDILGCDPYPIPNVSLRNVTDMTESAVRATFGLKPVLTILPAYESKLPTLADLRCMATLAICAGANGIGIYAWDDRLYRNGKWTGYYMAEHPDTMKTVTSVIQDILKIEPILLEPNIAGAVSVNDEQLAVHAAVKRSGGKDYLFVANDSRREESATLTLKSRKTVTAKPLPVFGCEKPLKFNNGKCQLSIPAVAAGVYELSE